MPYEKLCLYPGCPCTFETGSYCDKHRPKRTKPRGSGRQYRTKAWRYTRAAVFDRDGYHCKACGKLIDGSPHCDHITPISDGGSDDMDNLQTLCDSCHSKKTARGE